MNLDVVRSLDKVGGGNGTIGNESKGQYKPCEDMFIVRAGGNRADLGRRQGEFVLHIAEGPRAFKIFGPTTRHSIAANLEIPARTTTDIRLTERCS